MYPLKYLVVKPVPSGKAAWWHLLFVEFEIYIMQKPIKRQATIDHLAENRVDDYQSMTDFFLDKSVFSMGIERNLAGACVSTEQYMFTKMESGPF